MFCYYALSPSTERVIFFSEPVPGGDLRILGELRAYGPSERFVWYESPSGPPRLVFVTSYLTRPEE